MINDYFENVSNNEKKDLACEIIIELGDKEYWDTKDETFKKKMSEVYKKQVDDLELLVPNFKVASAIIHYDETSPHMHIVGVPIKEKNKNGMSKLVGKSDVFTKESLIKLQDNMRTLCIEEFNEEYNLNTSLKKKQKGRNRDIHVSDMDNYIEMKKQLEKNTESLERANKKSLELKQNSKDIKDKNDKIKTLTENNEALSLRVKTLEKNNKEKDNQIISLKNKIFDLSKTIEFWKNKFEKLINFLHSKIHNWFDKDDKYIDVINEMYQDNVLDDEEIEELDLNKEKDDYER